MQDQELSLNGKNSKIPIPQKFQAAVIGERNEAGRRWLQALPSLVDEYCRRWDLSIDGDVMHGHISLVVPVHRGIESYVLKIGWIDDETKDEALALRIWSGVGAVKLIQSDDKEGIMLLESLDADTTLSDIPIDEAVKIAAHLLRRLAVPAPTGMLKLSEYIGHLSQVMDERWGRLNKPFAKEILTKVQTEIEKLSPLTANLITNQDLHYGNVLAGKREKWLVIDPKVVAGDPEFGLAPLLWRRPEGATNAVGLTNRFTQLVREASLDKERAYGWTLIRTVEYWLWALDFDLTEDPKRCELITNWLLGNF